MDYLIDVLYRRCFSNRLDEEEYTPVRKNSITQDDYESSGCIFTDGIHTLAGYQPKKIVPRISGLGGSKNTGEVYLKTAIRETLEELFEIEASEELINDIGMYVMPRRTLSNNGYIIVEYSFEDLQDILEIVKTHGVKSKLYETQPKNVADLIFKRIVHPDSEITHLALLPLVAHDGQNFVGGEFISDMNLLLSK